MAQLEEQSLWSQGGNKHQPKQIIAGSSMLWHNKYDEQGCFVELVKVNKQGKV